MAIEKQLQTEAPEQELLTDEEEKDLSIMVNLAKNMIDDGGIEVIRKAENSKDPGQIVGQFLFQLGGQLIEQLSGKVDVSPRVLLVEGGWVEQVSDYLQEEYDVPKNVMDRAEIYVASTAQQMAQTQQQEQAQQPPGAPPVAAPPAMPQQAPQGGM